MRKLAISFVLAAALALSRTTISVNANADSYTRVYVPLPYILSTSPGRMGEQESPEDTGAAEPRPREAGNMNAQRPTSPGIAGNHINLSAIPANRGVFSYVIYRLLYPDEQHPPEISEELKTKYGYGKYSDKRFEPVMMDYTIWAIDSGYLSPAGKANHLLGVKWSDIQSLLTVLEIQPAEAPDYSIYDYENWGFVTDSEKTTIGTFLAAFGRGIDTRSIERQEYTLTIADLVCLASNLRSFDEIEIDDDEMHELTGYTFGTAQDRPPTNGAILTVCFPYAQNDLNKTVISDLKIWAKKEGLLYEN